MGGSWCNTNFPDLFEELQASVLRLHRIRWLGIGVLAWTLWTIRNRLVIQRAPLRQPSDAIYKMCGYLQLWRSLSRVTDRDAITILIADLRALALRFPHHLLSRISPWALPWPWLWLCRGRCMLLLFLGAC